jgi:hypothetical protein
VLTRGEALLASATATLAFAILIAYLPYRLGWRVSPAAVLALTIIAASIVTVVLIRLASPAPSPALALVVVVAGTAAFFLALAVPDLLPLGGGPDLAHHLVLINYIERNWRLVDDPALYPYLGDMMDYTPGGHLLIALAGAWTRTAALRMVHPVLVLTVALKAGVIFSIARLSAIRRDAATLTGFAAVILLFVPYAYFAGSFTTHSYWPQVVSELFACAAWWMVVAWNERPHSGIATVFALVGAATFVTWPIWVGPIVVLYAAALLLHGSARSLRVQHAAIGLVPIALIATFHSFGRAARLQMAGTSGFVIQPSPDTLGWFFIVAAGVGLATAIASSNGRLTITFAAAIGLQALALYGVARYKAADTPYLALKMIYLAVYPLAVAAALAFSHRRALATIATVALGLVATRQIIASPKPQPIVTRSVWRAGVWSRDHLDPACVDYLVADGYSGYWLHLAVLDNPRGTARFNDPDTFEPKKAIERWVDLTGLPYAIVDDVNGFSKALFNGTDTVAQFDRSMVIKRRGGASCPRQ